MIEQRHQGRIARFLRKAIAFAAVVALSLAGLFFYEGFRLAALNDPAASEKARSEASKGRYFFRRREVADKVARTMRDNVAAIDRELDGAATAESLERLRVRAGELQAYGNHPYGPDLTALSRKIDRAYEEFYYRRILDTDDLEKKRDACNEYFERCPNGSHGENVRRVLEGLAGDIAGKARQSVNAAIPGSVKRNWPGFLQKKAAAVDGYRKEYAEESLRPGMERASQLASLLATKKTHAVTLHSAGTLADIKPTRMVVVDGGGRTALESPAVESRTPAWEEPFELYWQPGDRIEVRWAYVDPWSSWLWDGPIAARSDEELDSLKSLSGSVDLIPGEKREYLAGGQKPTVRFSIEGIDEDAWRNFREYIFPGDFWKR
jgi:hypothetical protein